MSENEQTDVETTPNEDTASEVVSAVAEAVVKAATDDVADAVVDAVVDQVTGGDEVTDSEAEYTDLVRVHQVSDIAEAQLVKSILESFNIPCMVEDDMGADVGVLAGSHLDGIDITVPTALAEKAYLVLCERGVICPVEPDELEALVKRAESIELDDIPALDAFAHELDNEHKRDLRHALLTRLGTAGKPGFETALTLMAHSAKSEAEEIHILHDVAFLTNRGAFGSSAAVKGRCVGVLSRLAGSASPLVRARAAQGLGKLRGSGSGAPLVALLEDDDPKVRDEAIEALFSVSNGKDMDFDADKPHEERDEAVARWREWLAAHPNA
ncbi:MAG: HEAT repeat domain-containing protein [Planctomycetota bacterium]|jgi:hypothetical protein